MPKAKRAELSQEPEDMSTLDTIEAGPSQAPDERPAKKSKKARKPERSGAEQPYENGVLRELVLENFMNHKHLRVEFDPHVNFIVGKNGSGKSAIVNALIAGFGHKASSTGRNTNSAKSLIMHGKDYALIQIHLANGGPDAYKPEEFGDTIVAEHRIERSGAGHYKLRDGPDGHIRKSSKNEFSEMCQHFNIQASNPCALLTQEHAKKFLHNGDEGARYTFFLQAANLESRKHDLNATLQNVTLLKQRLERAEEGMADKLEHARKCQEIYDGAQKLKELTSEEEKFEALLGWALIGDKESELQAEIDKEAAAMEAEEKAKADAEAAKVNQQQLEEKSQRCAREHAEAVKAIERFAAAGEKAKQAVHDKHKQLKKAKKLVSELTAELQECEHTEKALSDEYERDLSALESSKNKAQVEQARKRAALNEEVREREAGLGRLGEQIQAMKETYQRAIDDFRAAKAAEEEAAADAQAKEAELDAAKKASFDRTASLHPDLPQLMQLIDTHKKHFRTPPLGPVGLNIQIKPEHKQLAAAAEAAMGSATLLTFAVNQTGDQKSAKDDEKQLRKLIAQIKPKKSKMTSLDSVVRVTMRDFNEARHDVSPSGAAGSSSGSRRASSGGEEGLVKLLDAVEVTAPGGAGDVFYNLLVDQCNADRVMLFQDQEEAEKAVYGHKEATATGIVRLDYTSSARRVMKRNQTTANEHMNYLRMMLVTDKKAAIAQLTSEAKAAKAKAAECDRTLRAANDRRKSEEQAELGKRKEFKLAEQTLFAKRDELDRFQGESAADHVTQALQESEAQLNDIRDRCTQLKQDLEQAKVRQADADVEYLPLKEKFDAAIARYNEMMEREAELKQAAEEASAPVKKSVVRRTSVTKSLALAQKEQQEAAQNVARLQQWIAQMSPGVEEAFGPRVFDPKKRTVAQLKEEQKKLKAKILAQQNRYGGKDLVQLAQEAASARQLADAGAEDVATVKEIGQKQQESFEERSRFFKKEAKVKGKNAGLDFNTRLSQKGHAGRLIFDHDAETLSLEVTRNNQDENSAATSDARNLSGGERSFTTLSFELAMWEFCETPFRVLDEFDVYMDDTYRRQAVEVLMELCDQQRERQFLFVTPQDMHPFLQREQLQEKLQADFKMPRITKMKDVR